MALPQTTSRVPIFSRMKAGSDEAQHRNTHAANMGEKSKAKIPDSFFLSFPMSAAPVIKGAANNGGTYTNNSKGKPVFSFMSCKTRFYLNYLDDSLERNLPTKNGVCIG